MRARPFLRWIGGKGRNIEQFVPFLPPQVADMFYVEPFVGSGAMLFRLSPIHALISDVNLHLINTYNAIKTRCPFLIEALECHDSKDSEPHYYEQRDAYNAFEYDVDVDISNLFAQSDAGKNTVVMANDYLVSVDQAARFLYLNARVFNGLYRENQKGEFNAPYAKDLKGLKKICVKPLYHAVSRFLREHDVTIEHCSFERVPVLITNLVKPAYQGRIFYFLDPPYYPITETSQFTSYTSCIWDDARFEQFKSFVDWIDDCGDLFLVCNHAVPFIKDLFKKKGYRQYEHDVSRSISCKANDRKPAREIVVTNYPVNRLRRSSLEDFRLPVDHL